MRPVRDSRTGRRFAALFLKSYLPIRRQTDPDSRLQKMR